MALVPLLEEGVLLQAPPAKLPSEAYAIQLIWGQVNANFCGFQLSRSQEHLLQSTKACQLQGEEGNLPP